MFRLLPSAFVLALGAALLAGCVAKPTGAALDTAVKVTYADAIERENLDYEEYTGRTVAVKTVEVRPQMTAILEKVLFKDGDTVKKGQPLYLLDAASSRRTSPRPKAPSRVRRPRSISPTPT